MNLKKGNEWNLRSVSLRQISKNFHWVKSVRIFTSFSVNFYWLTSETHWKASENSYWFVSVTHLFKFREYSVNKKFLLSQPNFDWFDKGPRTKYIWEMSFGEFYQENFFCIVYETRRHFPSGHGPIMASFFMPCPFWWSNKNSFVCSTNKPFVFLVG